jgi:hypothetical protein
LSILLRCVRAALLACWITPLLLAGGGATGAPLPPTAEFDIPYELRVLGDGATLELSGSFSWAVPQNLQAMLAAAPGVRVIRLESPGGHLQPALQVAAIIRERGLDTYVGRFCASACTLPFLAGRQRWLAPNARLGFHQAWAPGFPPAEANALLRASYERFGLKNQIIAHALQTPPSALWVPPPEMLATAGLTTGVAPAAVVAGDDGRSPNLRELARHAGTAADAALIQFAGVLADLLAQLAAADPEACWAFAHDGAIDLHTIVPAPALDALTDAENHLADAPAAPPPPAANVQDRKAAAADVARTLRANGRGAVLGALQSGADHAAFCAALHEVLQTALALPAPQNVRDLRALLAQE